jgi:leucyl aminopeptidase
MENKRLDFSGGKMKITLPELEILEFDSNKERTEYFSLFIQHPIGESRIKYNFGEIVIADEPASKDLILHVGDETELSPDNWRKLGGTLAKFLRSHHIFKLFVSKEVLSSIQKEDFKRFLEGFFLGNYRFNIFKKDSANEKIAMLIESVDDSLKSELKKIQKLSSIVNYARGLGQLPANVINPSSLADICVEMAQQFDLQVKVIDANELQEMGAEGLFSVGKGSASQPKMIVIEYTPNKSTDEQPIVLVGKAITFDTGGYSLKSVDGIQGMKYDKLGGITVLASVLAATVLEIPKNVVGIICTAENMISDVAYRPDDIIKTLSGKTVEILSTDAEGRLVLADGLTYAQRNYKPHCIIDFATLTGGIVVALGKIRAGLFSNNSELSDQLFESGEHTFERLWPMPLDDDYFEFIKGDDADLKNAGGREGHPIMGAIFLKQFIESEIPWAHIDIAGAATSTKAENYQPKGANGFGIRLMVDYLNNLK